MLQSRLLLVLFLLALGVKFGLIWESEIVDATDDPHEYVLQILYPANGGLAYTPGTGIAGRVLYDLGIPFRLGLEAAFMLAMTLLLRALFAWPWKSRLALGLFVATLFDPALADLFTHLFSDEPWLLETLLGLTCLVLAFRREGRIDLPSLAFSLAFLGLSILTRSIFVVLVASTMLFALMALAALLSKFRSAKLKRNLDLLAVAVPVLILGLSFIYLGACHYSYVRHGYRGLSFLDCQEYKDFYLCLQSVGPPDGSRYFPIDQNRRKLIAQAGPTSAWFIHEVEDNSVYKEAGLENYGAYDIPAGWFHWAAFAATMRHGDYMTSFALFHDIEGEIDAAHRAGVLPVRSILPLPDSRLGVVGRGLPLGLRNVLARIISEPSPAAFAAKNRSPWLSPEFTRALTRRAVHDSPWRDRTWQFLTVVYAWIYSPVTLGLYFLALTAFWIAVFRRWNRIDEFSLAFLARQFFHLLFLVLILWYALFDASGMPVLPRYMIFNHVLLLPLICLSLAEAWPLIRKQDPAVVD